MSFYIEAVFRISEKQLTKYLISAVIDSLHASYGISIGGKEKEKFVEIIYAGIRGEFKGYMELSESGIPYRCGLFILTNAKDKKGLSFIPVPESVVYLVLSAHLSQFDDDYEAKGLLSGKALREAFIRDAKIVYSVLHPDWGAMGMNSTLEGLAEESASKDISDFLYPVNFYGPGWAKNINKKVLQKFSPYRLEELDDGGLLVQFGEYLDKAIMKQDEHKRESTTMKEMAKALAAMTGQNVWWKGHEKELGWEE